MGDARRGTGSALAKLYRRAADLDLQLGNAAPAPPPDRILMVDPGEFDVAYALNPHQLDASGELKPVDNTRAREQWQALHDEFVSLDLRVEVLPAVPGLCDLVFCANQALPIPAFGGRPACLVPSRMASTQRAPEVPLIEAFLRAAGLAVEPLRGPAERFEGMGDGLWHPGRRFLWAGVGPRSSAAAWEEISARHAIPAALLTLLDPDFYHLDTCFTLLDESSCLWTPAAFEDDARGLVEALIPRRIEADPDESRTLLANNAFCPDGRHVVIQSGCTETEARLAEAGFVPRPVDTGEFVKSGGSVFCMKLHWGPL